MTVARTSLHRIVTMQTKKLKKLATEFLWANAGDSFGCNGGGKRIAKKMPWVKFAKKGQGPIMKTKKSQHPPKISIIVANYNVLIT